MYVVHLYIYFSSSSLSLNGHWWGDRGSSIQRMEELRAFTQKSFFFSMWISFSSHVLEKAMTFLGKISLFFIFPSLRRCVRSYRYITHIQPPSSISNHPTPFSIPQRFKRTFRGRQLASSGLTSKTNGSLVSVTFHWFLLSYFFVPFK